MGIKKPQLVKVEAFNIFYIGGFATPALPRGRRIFLLGGAEGMKKLHRSSMEFFIRGKFVMQ